MLEGVYQIPSEEYHRDPCPEASLSRSVIKDLIYRTPRHAWENHPRLNPDYQNEEKAIFDLGSAAHSLFLEGLDNAVPLDYPDWRTNDAKKKRDEIRSAGKHPLLRHQYDEVNVMVTASHSFLRTCELHIDSLYNEGKSEVTYIWKDNGVWCRSRLDWISNNKNLILDYKTTGLFANPDDYERNIFTTGLDVQDAYYREGVNQVEHTFPQFVFLIQETKRPYLCSLMELSEQYSVMAQEKISKAKKLWKRCLKNDDWPGYPANVAIIDPPPWVTAKWEEKRQYEEVA